MLRLTVDDNWCLISAFIPIKLSIISCAEMLPVPCFSELIINIPGTPSTTIAYDWICLLVILIL